MMRHLKKLLPRPLAVSPAVLPPPEPAEPVYAVGDVHGRADLLSALLQRLETDMHARGVSAAKLVFLGDIVDRGEDTAEALEQVFRLAREHPARVVCLMGNHERMMLDFLDAPEPCGARWLRNGGLQTLASYRIGGLGARAGGAEMTAAAAALRAALPGGLEDWLRGLPMLWRSGNLVCVHAALDPGAGPDDQEPETLVWGHPRFLREPRHDGLWVVHGHTVMDAPVAQQGRISIDTGACYTGRLTAAAVLPGAPVRFLQG